MCSESICFGDLNIGNFYSLLKYLSLKQFMLSGLQSDSCHEPTSNKSPCETPQSHEKLSVYTAQTFHSQNKKQFPNHTEYLNIQLPESMEKDSLSNCSHSPRNFNLTIKSGPMKRNFQNDQQEETEREQIGCSSPKRWLKSSKISNAQKDLIFEEMANRIMELGYENQNYQEQQIQLEQIIAGYRDRYERQSNQDNENMQQLQIILMQTEKIQLEMEGLKKSNSQLQRQLQESLAKQSMLTAELNESEEINYSLRLKIQQLSHELLKRPELDITMEEWRGQKEKKVINLQQKINKMEIMKKQYLKAYSKIKAEKEELQIKLIDMQDQLKQQQARSGSPDMLADKLKTIVQIPQEEFRESLNRISRLSDGYPTAHVKQLLEKALDEVNKLQSQKHIKTAINFLTFHEIQCQDIEEIHSYYKNLLLQIEKSMQRERNKYQREFDELLNKLISNKKTFSPQKNSDAESREAKSEPGATSDTKYQIEVQNFDENFNFQLTSPQVRVVENNNSDILAKLQASLQRQEQLKQKYNKLMEEQHKTMESIMGKDSNTKKQQENGVEKQVKDQTEDDNERIGLEKVCELIYEILCEFPLGNHLEVFFKPKNILQIEKALNVLHRFAKKYSQVCASQKKQTKQSIFELIKLVQESVRKTDFSYEQFVQLISNRKFTIFHDEICLKLNEISKQLPKQKVEVKIPQRSPEKTTKYESINQSPLSPQSTKNQNFQQSYQDKKTDPILEAQIQELRKRMGI